MRVNNFREVHSVLKELPRIEVLEHRNPVHNGEIRRVTLVQQCSFYSVIDGDPEHWVSRKNRGKGSDTWLGNSSCVEAEGDICLVKNVLERKNHDSVFMKFRIMEDNE